MKGETTMNVTATEFIQSPDVYLDRVDRETITIMKDGLAIG